MIQSVLCIALLAPSQAAQESHSNEVWFLDLQQADGSWDADRFPEEVKGLTPVPSMYHGYC